MMASAMPPGRKCSGCSATSSYSGLRKLEPENYFIGEISVPHWPTLTNRTSHRACDEVQESPPDAADAAAAGNYCRNEPL
jgi:hypothetical protein